MELNIVFLDEHSIGNVDVSAIKALGNYVSYPGTEASEIVERSKDADVLITNKVPLKGDIFESLPKLKLICVAATGMNTIDLEAAKNAGVEVRNVAGYSTNSVAELTVCMALSLLRQVIYYDNFVKSGQYAESECFTVFDRPSAELYGKKWGIIGLGNIGRQVARLATAFGCTVVYHSTSGDHVDKDYQQLELDALLREADIVSIHAPLSRKTFNIIDYHQLSLMKKSAIIINTARGKIINEDGLTRALNDGFIAGAATDVYSQEPIAKDSPLYRVKDKYKLVATPHIAWSTTEALNRLVEQVAQNIRDYSAQKSKAGK